MTFREILPLYRTQPKEIAAEAPNHECARCELKKAPKKVCLPPEITQGSGGVLVVAPSVNHLDDSAQRHLYSQSGQYVRALLREMPDLTVSFDSFIKCAGGEAEKCASYFSHTVQRTAPSRIIALGEATAYHILGRSHAEGSISRWQGYFKNIPVFVVPDPLRAVRNKFLKDQFRDDLEWALTADPMPSPALLAVNVANTRDETILALRQATSFQLPVAIDCEWSGNSENSNFRLLSIALAVNDYSWVWDEKGLRNPDVSAPLKDFLLSPHKKVGHHAKADIRALWAWLGRQPNNLCLDTRLMWKVQAPEAAGDLDSCADMVGMGGHKDEAKKELEKAVRMVRKLAQPTEMFDRLPPDALDSPKTYAFAYIPRDTLLRYNALDTVATHRLWREMDRRLEDHAPAIRKTLNRTIMPASLALVKIEKWGAFIDPSALSQYATFLAMRRQEIETRFAAYGEFNPGSTADLGKLLYDTLKLPVPFKTESGKPSTDKEALKELLGQHPVVADIMEWKKITKHEGTYAVGLRNAIASDGRIHPFYNTDGAETGRISCSSPNLQTIPRADSDEGRMARDLFAAPRGKVLVQADYSQLELRVAAAIAKDPVMVEVFNSGVDYHLRTAQMVSKVAWGIEPEQVEKKHRTAAKSCIAEDSLVLTDSGHKKIQDVELSDLLWDGVEWVTHGGVIYNGVREVIEYDGLTATPDHIVFTADGREVSFGQVAAEQGRLAVTESAGKPLRYADVPRTVCNEVEAQVHTSDVQCVPSRHASLCLQHPFGKNDELSLHDAQDSTFGRDVSVLGPTGTSLGGTVRRDSSTDLDSDVSGVSGLRGAWDQELVCRPRCVCGVLPKGTPAFDVQERTDRPDQQRRTLRAGELEDRFSEGELEEHSSEQVLRVQRAAGDLSRPVALAEDGLSGFQLDAGTDVCAGAGRSACRGNLGEGTSQAMGKKVYDILNAGPRNRFTVSGRLVHNCNFGLLYGRGDKALAEQINCTEAEAAAVRQAVLGNFKQLDAAIKGAIATVRRTGEIWTLWNGEPARRRNLSHIADQDNALKSSAERQAFNTVVQGSASDLCLTSVAQIVKWIEDDCVPAKLVLTVHDSIMVECDKEVQDEVVYHMRRIMEGQPCGGVPIVVDVEVGERWGSLEKV